MPTKKAIPKTPRTGRVVDHVARLLAPKQPLIEPSLAVYERLDELAQPTRDELPCSLCDGVGLPKIDGTDMRICVVCRAALRDIPRPNRRALIYDRERYMLHRLPYFRDWLISPDRMGVATDNRMSA